MESPNIAARRSREPIASASHNLPITKSVIDDDEHEEQQQRTEERNCENPQDKSRQLLSPVDLTPTDQVRDHENNRERKSLWL